MIRAWMVILWSRVWPYIATVSAAFGAVLAIRQSGKRAGRHEAEIKAQEKRLKNINEARNVENKTSALDDDSVVRRLDEWVRKR